MNEIGASSDLDKLIKPGAKRSTPSLSYLQANQIVLASPRIGSPVLDSLLIKRFQNEPEKMRDPYIPAIDRMLLEHLQEPLKNFNALLPASEGLRDTARDPANIKEIAFSLEIMVPFMKVVRQCS